MSGFHTNIEKDTVENENFRKVLFTTERTQLVLMTLKPGEEIGLETHDDHDQFICIEKGSGKATIGEDTYALEDGSAVVVPAGEEHNVVNIGEGEDLRLYTIYTPPEHEDGTVHATKAEAEADEAS